MISKKVHDELMSVRRVLHYLPVSPSTEYGWTPHERRVFWVALDRYPRGPWTVIAEFIGTKSTRQAMTHGQKLRQKLKRWVTRLNRNPAARSLMDGVVSGTPTSAATISTEISVAVSTPRSFVAPTGGPSCAVKQPTTNLQPNVYRDRSPACSAVDHANTSTSPPEQETPGYTSAGLQLLFNPHAIVNSSVCPVVTASSLDPEEAKHEDATCSSVPYPIEAALPGRNLLDELADALWNGQDGEHQLASLP